MSACCRTWWRHRAPADGSPTFGPRIRAGRPRQSRPVRRYDSFMGATQQVIDSIDPVNYGFITAQNASCCTKRWAVKPV